MCHCVWFEVSGHAAMGSRTLLASGEEREREKTLSVENQFLKNSGAGWVGREKRNMNEDRGSSGETKKGEWEVRGGELGGCLENTNSSRWGAKRSGLPQPPLRPMPEPE